MGTPGKLLVNILTGLLAFLLAGPLYAQLVQSALPAVTASAFANIDSSDNSTVFVSDITISGDKQTKSYVIEREVNFRRGETILKREVERRALLSKQQLMNTTLFTDVNVQVVPLSGDIIMVHIAVKERWYIFPVPFFDMVDRNFNTWWVEHKRSLQRVNYGLKFFHNNVSGRNDKVNLLLVGGYTQQAALRYENPFMDKNLRHGMNLGFSFSRNRELNYDNTFNKQNFFRNDNDFLITQFHLDAAYSYRPGIKTRHYLRAGYHDLRIKDTISKLNPDYFAINQNRLRFPDVSYAIQYFNVDYIPYPLKGFMGDASIYKRFGTNNNFWQVGGKGTYTKKLLPNSYLRLQAAGTVRFPFDQPFFNQRLFGGRDMYMRGMEYYVVDGVAGGMLRATAVQQALKFSINNPFKIKSLGIDNIPVRVFIKAYGDAGYAYHPEPGSSMFNNKLLRTWGLGIDIVTIYDVVLKLEYSFNQLGEKGLYIHSQSDF